MAQRDTDKLVAPKAAHLVGLTDRRKSATDAFGHGGQVTDDLTDRFGFEVSIASNGVVELTHVGVVVLGVVDFHGLSVDVGFERVVGVSEFGK